MRTHGWLTLACDSRKVKEPDSSYYWNIVKRFTRMWRQKKAYQLQVNLKSKQLSYSILISRRLRKLDHVYPESKQQSVNSHNSPCEFRLSTHRAGAWCKDAALEINNTSKSQTSIARYNNPRHFLLCLIACFHSFYNDLQKIMLEIKEMEL